MKYCIMALLLTAQVAVAFSQSKIEQDLSAVIKASPNVTGVAALDLTTGKMIAVNGERSFTQASAIKIPILMEVYKQVHAGKIALTDQKLVTAANRVGGSGILLQLQDTASLSVRDLCTYMITQSDNTATNIVISTVGMENVTKTMAAIGFPNTKLQRYMMDTKAAAEGRENLSTPAEAVKVLELLYQGKFVNKEVSEQVITVIKKNARIGSRIGAAIPFQVPVAFKPGGLPNVSTEWALVYLDKRPYAITVMENNRVANDKSETMEKLSRIIYEYFLSLANMK